MRDVTSPTKGDAYTRREGQSTVYVFVQIGGGWVQEVAACGPTANGSDEQQANADLIAEAFQACHRTGHTPRQLVERVEELEAVVKAALKTAQLEEQPFRNWHNQAIEVLERAQQNQEASHG